MADHLKLWILAVLKSTISETDFYQVELLINGIPLKYLYSIHSIIHKISLVAEVICIYCDRQGQDNHHFFSSFYQKQGSQQVDEELCCWMKIVILLL